MVSPALMYSPKMINEKHSKRKNDIPHAKPPCMIFHTPLTAWCSWSWTPGTCIQHPPKRGVQDEHGTSSRELGGAAALSSLLKHCCLCESVSWKFWGFCGLNPVTVKISAASVMCSAASPPLLGHVNVNVNHQDRSKGIKTAAFPVPAVTFRALFKPVMVIGRTCRSLLEDPNHPSEDVW